jgi:hypothetical protein
MTQPQAQQPKQLGDVSGFGISRRDMEAYRITNAFCGTCGEPGLDRCPACRRKEQERIARLDAMPGGKEIGQGSDLE